MQFSTGNSWSERWSTTFWACAYSSKTPNDCGYCRVRPDRRAAASRRLLMPRFSRAHQGASAGAFPRVLAAVHLRKARASGGEHGGPMTDAMTSKVKRRSCARRRQRRPRRGCPDRLGRVRRGPPDRWAGPRCSSAFGDRAGRPARAGLSHEMAGSGARPAQPLRRRRWACSRSWCGRASRPRWATGTARWQAGAQAGGSARQGRASTPCSASARSRSPSAGPGVAPAPTRGPRS